MHNADRVVPEWEMKVGDQMRMGPQGYPVNQVVALERGSLAVDGGRRSQDRHRRSAAAAGTDDVHQP